MCTEGEKPPPTTTQTTTPSFSTTPTTTPKWCPEGEWLCHDGSKCILNEWKCDFEADCPDASDQSPEFAGCSTEGPSTTTTTVCDATVNKFQCTTGKCINIDYVCDNYDDCDGDGSDESAAAGCTTTTVLTTTTTGDPKYQQCVVTSASCTAAEADQLEQGDLSAVPSASCLACYYDFQEVATMCQCWSNAGVSGQCYRIISFDFPSDCPE